MTAGFIVYDDFFGCCSGVYRHVTGNEVGGHCVIIIGHDDATGCWTCKNSWLNDGADGIENTGWQTNQHVIGLWAVDQDRNAWVDRQALGWRKRSPDDQLSPGDRGGLKPARADIVGGGAIGAAGVREFVLRPTQAGTYALSFKHWREWEGDSSVIGRFDLSVVVQ